MTFCGIDIRRTVCVPRVDELHLIISIVGANNHGPSGRYKLRVTHLVELADRGHGGRAGFAERAVGDGTRQGEGRIGGVAQSGVEGHVERAIVVFVVVAATVLAALVHFHAQRHLVVRPLLADADGLQQPLRVLDVLDVGSGSLVQLVVGNDSEAVAVAAAGEVVCLQRLLHLAVPAVSHGFAVEGAQRDGGPADVVEAEVGAGSCRQGRSDGRFCCGRAAALHVQSLRGERVTHHAIGLIAREAEDARRVEVGRQQLDVALQDGAPRRGVAEAA